jgi:hypothetical protein
MVTYSEAKQNVFATGIVPDGFFGKTAPVEFSFDLASGNTFAVTSVGYFTYHTPPAVDTDEAYWLLNNHPSSNATLLRRI